MTVWSICARKNAFIIDISIGLYLVPSNDTLVDSLPKDVERWYKRHVPHKSRRIIWKHRRSLLQCDFGRTREIPWNLKFLFEFEVKNNAREDRQNRVLVCLVCRPIIFIRPWKACTEKWFKLRLRGRVIRLYSALRWTNLYLRWIQFLLVYYLWF